MRPLRNLARRAVLLGLCVLCATCASARADAPRTARIVEGRSMAGVPLALYVPRTAANDAVVSGPLTAWGQMQGFCFEGTNCLWNVSGGGTTQVILDARNGRISRMVTNAKRWRTSAGVGRGSTTGALRRAYGRRIVRRATCGLNGFGGDNIGYVLPGRRDGERRFTFFEVAKQRVTNVWIGRGRAGSGTGC